MNNNFLLFSLQLLTEVFPGDYCLMTAVKTSIIMLPVDSFSFNRTHLSQKWNEHAQINVGYRRNKNGCGKFKAI